MNKELFDNNSRLKKQNDYLQNDINNLKLENNRKVDTIKELQQELSLLEQENFVKYHFNSIIGLQNTKQNRSNEYERIKAKLRITQTYVF